VAGGVRMPIKKFGIFILYRPFVDLRAEGLGRYLAKFLSACEKREDIEFIIVCPDWCVLSITELCKDEGLDVNTLTFVTPRKKYFFVSFSHLIKRVLRLKNRTVKKPVFSDENSASRVESVSRKEWKFLAFVKMMIQILVLFPFRAMHFLFFHFRSSCIHMIRHMMKKNARVKSAVAYWKDFSAMRPYSSSKMKSGFKDFIDQYVMSHYHRFLDLIYQDIADHLISLMHKNDSVLAWYCPTAFWPTINKLQKPKLICLPDFFPAEFPVSFSLAKIAEQSVKDTYSVLEHNHHFVTYSAHIKNKFLVEKFQKKAGQLYVIPHAPSKMPHADSLNNVSLLSLLQHSDDHTYFSGYQHEDMKFFFYPTRFRPNKNIMNLLKAYNHLLKRRYIGHKLVLTCSRHASTEIAHFIVENNLVRDVIFLNKLSVTELSACYKFADIAINPSLSEGGFPFTFTEALSVGTPVLLANIAVTLEVVRDAALQALMLFDPYDWRSLAERMEWAVRHKSLLLEKQKVLYNELDKRTWNDVVNEHIQALENISQKSTTSEVYLVS